MAPISIWLKYKSNIFRDFLLPGIGIEQNSVEETLLDIAGEEAETFIDDPESCFFYCLSFWTAYFAKSIFQSEWTSNWFVLFNLIEEN